MKKLNSDKSTVLLAKCFNARDIDDSVGSDIRSVLSYNILDTLHEEYLEDLLELLRLNIKYPVIASISWDTDFYTYLRSQFTDLDTCIEFCVKWLNTWEQEIPGYPWWSCSMRMMSTHCSTVLEGKSIEDSGWDYTTTKYGVDIYYGMCSGV